MKALTFILLFFMFSTALFATQDKKTLTIRLTTPSGNSDVATIYFDEGITPTYNSHQDAAYVFSSIAGVPEIYSYTLDKKACSINGVGTLQTNEMVYLGYHVGYPGLYTLNATLDNFDPTTIIRLVDNKLGDTTDLREDFLQLQLDSNDISTERFQVLVSSAIKYTASASNCANSGGSITISPDSTIVWTECQLIDSTTQQVMQTYYNVGTPVTFNGLAEGSYEVDYTYNNYTAANFFDLSGNFVIASVGVPTQQIYTNQDVVFDAITTNADHFNWDFGDSTLIIGVAHPTQVYLIPGTYTVNLYAYNDLGCGANAQATVIVLQGETATGINEPVKKDDTVTTDAKQVNLNRNGAEISDNAQ